MKHLTLLLMATLVAALSGCAVYTPGPPGGVSVTYYDAHPYHHHDHRW